MKKVLYLFPSGKRAGAELLTKLIISNHDRKQWEPQAYFINPGPLVEDLNSLGIKTFIFDGERPRLKNPLSFARAVKHIAAVIRENKTDLVHSVMSYGHVFGGSAAMWLNIPEVWYQHGPTGTLDWIAGRVGTRSLFVNSKFIEEQEKRFYPWADRMKLIYPGIETTSLEQWKSEAEGFRRRFGLTPQHLVFGLVGRITPMKGQTVFVEAASKIRQTIPDARFLLIGDPYMESDKSYRNHLLQQIDLLKLKGIVQLTGFISPQHAALAACDVIVNASVEPEPFGLTVIEGMMLSRPVLAPNQGGPSEIIRHGIDGLLFKAGDVLSLSEEMRRVASSRELRISLSEKSRNSVLSRFTVERMVVEIEAEYRRILKIPLALKSSSV